MKRWGPTLDYLPARPDLGIDAEHPVALMAERADGQFYLVADVESANAWRYDEPEKDGWYLVSLLGDLVSTAFRTRAGWNRTDVLAWRPLPEPAKEEP